MKIAVIYKSKYGSTKKYAQWIAQELACDLYERRFVKPATLKGYDVIIYGGGLYAGGLSGARLITKNFSAISNKKLVLFTCGIADPKDLQNVQGIIKGLSRMITQEMQEKMKIFHLRGAIDYSKLGFIHKLMMAMFNKMVKSKDPASLRAEDKEMLDIYGKAVDFTDKTSITPLIEYVRGL